MHIQIIFVCFRLSIKWLKRAEQNKQTFLPPLQREVGATCCTRRDCEKTAWTSSPSYFGAFCLLLGAVPSYSSHSQNTKFISLSQNLPACRNLYFLLFLHADRSERSSLLFQYLILLIRLP